MKEKYDFYNIPNNYGLEDYKDAVDYIVKRYCKLEGLISIYIWGGQFTPGISDLDIVFVFENGKIPAMPFSKRIFYMMNKKYRYIARHPFFYIDKISFKNIRNIYPDAEFKLLYGENIKINKLSERNAHFSRIALMCDIITRHYPRDFLEQEIAKSINARDMLLRLNSLRHSLKSMELIKKEKNKRLAEKLNHIELLRKNWFKSNNFDLLASLNKDAIKISMDIAENLKNFLIDNNLVKIHTVNNIEYNGARNNTLFIKNWDKEISLNDMSGLIRNNKKFFSILPIEFAPQLIEYSRYKGPISSFIRDRLKGDLKYEIKYSSIIKKKAMILNKQAELALKLRHSDFVAFFDFGYRNKPGINNFLLNIARGLRD
ncbi:MAG: hypothetical protein AABX33_07025 [Nanoarchaeota archaeon]